MPVLNMVILLKSLTWLTSCAVHIKNEHSETAPKLSVIKGKMKTDFFKKA